MKIYILKNNGMRLYFSSLKKAVKFVVDKYVKTLCAHNYPNYFYSQWPHPKSWIDAGVYKIFETTLNVDEDAKEINEEKLISVLDECSKEI